MQNMKLIADWSILGHLRHRCNLACHFRLFKILYGSEFWVYNENESHTGLKRHILLHFSSSISPLLQGSFKKTIRSCLKLRVHLDCVPHYIRTSIFLFISGLTLPYVVYNHTVLMLQLLWHLMVQAVRPCLGLRAASGRHMSFLLLYWLVFLSGRNIIFISLHSEWQFLKIAPHQGIFITFCRPAWVARQLFISLHLSSISLSQKAHFSWQFSCFTLLWPSCLNCLACVIHSLRFTENNIAP